MDYTTIEVSYRGARGAIVLNRPEKLNPLSTAALRELVAAARELDEQPDVKVVG
jgi:enoyl-CoA hydratase/carnithine racemase